MSEMLTDIKDGLKEAEARLGTMELTDPELIQVADQCANIAGWVSVLCDYVKLIDNELSNPTKEGK